MRKIVRGLWTSSAKNVETSQRVECCNYFAVVWGLGAFYILDCHKIKNIDQKKAIMSGHMKKCGNGNIVCDKKVGLGCDKSWADPHGSDIVMKRCKNSGRSFFEKRSQRLVSRMGRMSSQLTRRNLGRSLLKRRLLSQLKNLLSRCKS